MIRRAIASTVVTAAVAAGTAACGGHAAAGAGAPDTIVIRNFAYQPADLTVPAGATVTVRNEDGAPHTVTALDGGFGTGEIGPGRTATFRAPGPGRYGYRCGIHEFMHGTLTVSR